MMESARIEDQAAPDSAPNVDTPSKDYQSNDKTTNGHATPTRDTTANGDITTLDQSEDSPSDKQVDSDSNSHSFVTLSPPTSPDKGYGDDVNSTVLRSLEGSTSSTEQPKSKLDNPDYLKKQRKMMDMESPISPGRERSLEPEEGQDIDLKVEITERLKHTAKNDSYISYKITTDSTRPGSLYEQSHYEVWRRYKDFEWLRDVLEKIHYTLITPPLPGKQISRFFDHKSETFLKERQKALDRFLKRLAYHPYFSFDRHLKVFLTADPDTFSSHVSENSGNSLKLLNMFSSSVKNATTYVMLKNPDPDYLKHAKYFAELGEKFSHLERVATRLHTDRDELSNNLEDFSSAMIQWATHEPHLAHPLQKVGTCIEACGSATKTLNEANAYSLLMASREYQLFSAAGVNAVHRRDALQYEKERAWDERDKRKKTHDDAAATGKVVKLPKLAEDVQKSSLDADKALDDLSRANEMLRVDIEKWGASKDREMCSLMKHLGDSHITYHQKCLDEWEVVLKLLKSRVSNSPPPELIDQSNAESEVEHRPDLLLPGSLPGKDSPSEQPSEKLEKSDSLDDLFS